MKYRDLREFIAGLEADGKLKRIQHPVSPHLEMTEIADRVLRAEGPALLFENPIKPDGTRYDYPVLANLFGTPERVALGMGADSVSKLREIGKTLAYLKEPEPPKGIKDAFSKLPLLKDIWSMAPNVVKNAPCQEIVWEGEDVDLYKLPIQHCWPEDVAPLVTWGLTVTRGPHKKRQNLGIYRQQLIGKNKLIMRWLSHRGGALDYQEFRKLNPDTPYPVAVALGCDPATILGAVTPVPDTLSEYQFAGLLRGSRTELVKCIGNDLQVPARAEIVLEGVIHPNETALEGPYGDHTGYYNEQDHFPVFTVERITMRENPIYHSTYTGKPGCWSFLRQFMYTKFIIVVDDDVNVRDWKEVIWAVTTRMDPVRDTVLMENTPIDYLDFASPVSGLGGKMGLDATNKWPGETNREWGRVIKKDPDVTAKIDEIWERLGL